MFTATNLKSLLPCAVFSAFLFAGVAQAQIVNPLWVADFENYEDGAVIASKATFGTSGFPWRLASGDNANMTATSGAWAQAASDNTFASVRIGGNRSSLNTRVQTRGFTAINYDHSANLMLGGDLRFRGTGTDDDGNGDSGVNTAANYLFSGTGTRASDNASINWQLSLGINQSLQFFANFIILQGTREDFVSVAVADPSLWYTFVTDIDKDTGIASVTVFDGSSVVWSTSSTAEYSINTVGGVEMSVTRPGSTGLRVADFDNITVGVVVPEPATTAVLMLLGVGALVAFKRRRRA